MKNSKSGEKSSVKCSKAWSVKQKRDEAILAVRHAKYKSRITKKRKEKIAQMSNKEYLAQMPNKEIIAQMLNEDYLALMPNKDPIFDTFQARVDENLENLPFDLNTSPTDKMVKTLDQNILAGFSSEEIMTLLRFRSDRLLENYKMLNPELENIKDQVADLISNLPGQPGDFELNDVVARVNLNMVMANLLSLISLRNGQAIDLADNDTLRIGLTIIRSRE